MAYVNGMCADVKKEKRMRIVVNDIAASKTGALSVLKDFYNYILNNDKENEWIFVLGDNLLEEKDNIRILIRKDVKAGWGNRLKFDFLTGAKYFEELKPDVVFSLQNTMPRGYRGKQVLYVHQPLGYQKQKRFSLLKGYEREYAIYQYFISRMIDASVKRADKVIVQTKWMEEAIVNKTGIPGERIKRIMPDIDVPGAYAGGLDDLKRPVEFFYPAGNILYKNHSLILDAVAILEERGIKDFSVAFTLAENEADFLACYKKNDRVKYLGKISREEVFDKYRKGVLIFPSYIETFGYPPAEARAVNGYVLASDTPFSREVLEGYQNVAFFNPFNAKELADLMQQILEGKLKKEMIMPATNENACSSWAEVVEEILRTGCEQVHSN